MSTNLTDESTVKSSPRRNGRLRRVLKRVFYLIIILIGAFAIYAWATGARQEPIETGEPHMKAAVYTDTGRRTFSRSGTLKSLFPTTMKS